MVKVTELTPLTVRTFSASLQSHSPSHQHQAYRTLKTFCRWAVGRKDRMAFIGPTTTRALKTWLARRPAPSPEAFVFVDRRGRPRQPPHLVQILHRLSAEAGLPGDRRV